MRSLKKKKKIPTDRPILKKQSGVRGNKNIFKVGPSVSLPAENVSTPTTDSESAVTQPCTISTTNQSANESCETQSDKKSQVSQSANGSETQSTEKSSVSQSANGSETQSTETEDVAESTPGEKRRRPWGNRKEKRAFFKQKKIEKRAEAWKAEDEELEKQKEEAKKILSEKNVDWYVNVLKLSYIVTMSSGFPTRS